jgi:hypothetical protein
MTEDVRRFPPDDEGREIWALVTDDGTRDASAEWVAEIGAWVVAVDMMLCIREDPLAGELRRAVTTVLRLVQGADAVEEEDRETWIVTGSPDPAALIRYAARAVDSFVPQIGEAFAVAARRDRREGRRSLLRPRKRSRS